MRVKYKDSDGITRISTAFHLRYDNSEIIFHRGYASERNYLCGATVQFIVKDNYDIDDIMNKAFDTGKLDLTECATLIATD